MQCMIFILANSISELATVSISCRYRKQVMRRPYIVTYLGLGRWRKEQGWKGRQTYVHILPWSSCVRGHFRSSFSVV
jgi:hypothetical protein